MQRRRAVGLSPTAKRALSRLLYCGISAYASAVQGSIPTGRHPERQCTGAVPRDGGSNGMSDSRGTRRRTGGIGKSNGLFHRPRPPTPCHPARCCPRLGSARMPRASGWPALDAAGRPPARTAAHGQDGWLGTGSLNGWSCSGGLIQTRRELEKNLRKLRIDTGKWR